MAESIREEDFVQLALKKNCLTPQQIAEGRKALQECRNLGLDYQLWDIVVEKGFLPWKVNEELLQALDPEGKLLEESALVRGQVSESMAGREIITQADATRADESMLPITEDGEEPDESLGFSRLKVRSDETGAPPELPGYKVIRQLEKGAMGEVYLAHQESLHREVAIKVLPMRLSRQIAVIRRLRREATALARLNHPNIVTAIDFGQHDSQYFLVMEYVRGRALAEAMVPGEPLPSAERAEEVVLLVGRSVVRALVHAGKKGILHRDIKPGNIMVTTGGRIKLCDLGLARDEGADDQITRPGEALGTPLYMPPEQARGEENLNFQSDIYSLGATMYHLAAGCPPYEAPAIGSLFHKILQGNPTPPSRHNHHLSSGFDELVLEMMALHREDRSSSLEGLLEKIETLLDEVRKGTKGRSSSTVDEFVVPLPTPVDETLENPYLLGGLGLLALVLITYLFSYWIGGEAQVTTVSKKKAEDREEETSRPEKKKAKPSPEKMTDPKEEKTVAKKKEKPSPPPAKQSRPSLPTLSLPSSSPPSLPTWKQPFWERSSHKKKWISSVVKARVLLANLKSSKSQRRRADHFLDKKVSDSPAKEELKYIYLLAQGRAGEELKNFLGKSSSSKTSSPTRRPDRAPISKGSFSRCRGAIRMVQVMKVPVDMVYEPLTKLLYRGEVREDALQTLLDLKAPPKKLSYLLAQHSKRRNTLAWQSQLDRALFLLKNRMAGSGKTSETSETKLPKGVPFGPDK